MTVEELKEAFESLKKEGYTDEEILKIVYIMYADGKIPLEDLRTMTEVLGWEFTDEFEAMSDEDKKTKGLRRSDKKAEGVDKEEVEDAKEFGDEEEVENKKTPEKETDDEDEDDDKKAARLFGFGGKKD